MALTPDQLLRLEKNQAERKIDSIEELYQLLYPLILRDFAHRGDIEASFEQTSQELVKLNLGLLGHTHGGVSTGPGVSGPGVYAGASSPAILVPEVVGDALKKQTSVRVVVDGDRTDTTVSEARVDFDDQGPDKPFSLAGD